MGFTNSRNSSSVGRTYWYDFPQVPRLFQYLNLQFFCLKDVVVAVAVSVFFQIHEPPPPKSFFFWFVCSACLLYLDTSYPKHDCNWFNWFRFGNQDLVWSRTTICVKKKKHLFILNHQSSISFLYYYFVYLCPFYVLVSIKNCNYYLLHATCRKSPFFFRFTFWNITLAYDGPGALKKNHYDIPHLS